MSPSQNVLSPALETSASTTGKLVIEPLFPFFLVNLLSGLTRMKVGTYVMATALSIIPGSLAYTFVGRQLGTINSRAELASPRLFLSFTVLGLFFLMPVVYKQFVRPTT